MTTVLIFVIGFNLGMWLGIWTEKDCDNEVQNTKK